MVGLHYFTGAFAFKAILLVCPFINLPTKVIQKFQSKQVWSELEGCSINVITILCTIP